MNTNKLYTVQLIVNDDGHIDQIAVALDPTPSQLDWAIFDKLTKVEISDKE